MASNLPGAGVCLGEHSVCILRAVKLDTDCSPLGGADVGIVTDAIVTLTADPDLEEGTTFEPKLGCGSLGFTYEEPDILKRYNINMELLYHSPELEAILVPNGTVLVGAAASAFVGKNMGFAVPNTNQSSQNGIYLEVISKVVGRGVGTCSPTGGALLPYATGHVFGKVVTTPGALNFQNDVRNLVLTGKAVGNPELYNGPWNDWPAVGYIKNSAYQWVNYSRTEYDAIAAQISCGYKTLPAAS